MSLKTMSILISTFQCAFMVAAVISTFLFAVYKLKYDRLYHVMQVLEVFGTPSDFHRFSFSHFLFHFKKFLSVLSINLYLLHME